MSDTRTADSIKNEVRQFLSRELRVDVHDPDFKDDVNLFDSGFLDSLGFATLITHLEGRYQVRFDPQELFGEGMMSLDGLARTLDARRKSDGGSAAGAASSADLSK
jgi:acyl carrier protein